MTELGFDLICAVAVQLVTVYVTFGLMAIGFGLMLAGPRGASAAARFLFQQPIEYLATQLGQLVSAIVHGLLQLIATLLRGVLQLARAATQFVLTAIVDPVLVGLIRLCRWLVFGRR